MRVSYGAALTMIISSVVVGAPYPVAKAQAAVTSASRGATSRLTIWRSTEQWRVDGSEQGDAFGDLRDFVTLRDGSLWILDFKDQTIRRFSATGKPLTAVGRRGSGPGELRNANGLVVHADGTVWVNDPSNGRLSVYRADGSFARHHTLPISSWTYQWGAWYDSAAGEIMDPVGLKRETRHVQVWRRLGPQGEARGQRTPPSCESGQSIGVSYRAETPGQGSRMGPYPFTVGGGRAPDGRGGLWCATPSSARPVLVRIGANDTLAQTALAVDPLAVTKAEREETIAQIRDGIRKYSSTDFDPAKIPNTKPGIAGLSVDATGRLWVQHARSFGVTRTTFDVYDARGAHLGRVTVPYRVRDGMPVMASGMSLWLAVLDDDDVVSVARFTLTP